MDLIKKITDADFDTVKPEYLNNVSRYASRGIICNEQNKIAMMYVKNKNWYKLPGGGIENNESKEEAFYREVLEETGYKSEIIKELGIIEEHKIKNNFMQISYCYVAKTLEKEHSNLSDHEISLGFQLRWMDINEALDVMNNSISLCSEYSAKFMLLRDKIIIENANFKSKI